MVIDDAKPPGIRLIHKGCGYSWTYHGRGKVYACCPQCRTPIKIDNSHADEEVKEDGSTVAATGPGAETKTG